MLSSAFTHLQAQDLIEGAWVAVSQHGVIGRAQPQHRQRAVAVVAANHNHTAERSVHLSMFVHRTSTAVMRWARLCRGDYVVPMVMPSWSDPFTPCWFVHTVHPSRLAWTMFGWLMDCDTATSIALRFAC